MKGCRELNELNPANAVLGVVVSGIFNTHFHLPLFLVDEKGMNVETANRLLSLSRLGGLVGQVSLGFFLDRVKTKRILVDKRVNILWRELKDEARNQ